MQRFREESINSYLDKFPIDIDEDIVETIYDNYVKAMQKRRPGSELPFNNFYTYVTTNAYYFRYKNSYVFGVINHSNFIPTHFSPAGLREGIELIKRLRMFDNVVFVVTPDLANMLKKLNFRVLPITLQKTFRGELVDKLIVSSNFLKSIWNELKGSFVDKTYVVYKYIKNKYYDLLYDFKRIQDKFKSVIDKDSYIDWENLEKNLYKDEN